MSLLALLGRTTISRPIATSLGVLAALAIVGCSDGSGIRHYQVPKITRTAQSAARPEATAASRPERWLAAIVPQGDQFWFFKLTGPPDPVAAQVTSFRAFMESLRFEEGKPKWALPAGWRQQAGTGMRFATLMIGSDEESLEMSVIPLPPTAGQTETECILSNVNRWRGQLGLAPFAASALDSEAERLELSDGYATLVDLTGLASGSGMAQGPFAGSAKARPVDDAGGDDQLAYTTPDGWQAGELNVSRGGITMTHAAAFQVVDGEASVEITVDRLPAAGTLFNVNRWRNQVGLGPLDQAGLDALSKDVQIDNSSADYVELIGSNKTILGAIAVRGSQAWYFKLAGDPELAAREKASFDAFLDSFQFP